MELVLTKYAAYFGDANDIYYDLQSLVFSTKKLPEDESATYPRPVADYGIMCPLLAKDFEGVEGFELFNEVAVAFKPVRREQEIIAGDKSQALNKDSATTDRMPCNYLEIGIAQELYFNTEEIIPFPNGRFYLLKPENYVNRETVSKCNNLSQNKYIAPGFRKGIRFVEGPKKNNCYGLFVYRKFLKTVL